MSSVERRALEWFASNDTGASSLTLARHMLGLSHHGPFGVSTPSDGGDLGRCLRLLSMVPEWEARIDEMRGLSHSWAALVPHWRELKALMVEETGPEFDKEKPAPRTYRRMSELTASARAADGWITIKPGASMRMKTDVGADRG